jgi:hypothetical protein
MVNFLARPPSAHDPKTDLALRRANAFRVLPGGEAAKWEAAQLQASHENGTSA